MLRGRRFAALCQQNECLRHAVISGSPAASRFEGSRSRLHVKAFSNSPGACSTIGASSYD